MDDQKPMTAEEAQEFHEMMMRESPAYREQWEKFSAMFQTLLADAEIPEE